MGDNYIFSSASDGAGLWGWQETGKRNQIWSDTMMGLWPRRNTACGFDGCSTHTWQAGQHVRKPRSPTWWLAVCGVISVYCTKVHLVWLRSYVLTGCAFSPHGDLKKSSSWSGHHQKDLIDKDFWELSYNYIFIGLLSTFQLNSFFNLCPENQCYMSLELTLTKEECNSKMWKSYE